MRRDTRPLVARVDRIGPKVASDIADVWLIAHRIGAFDANDYGFTFAIPLPPVTQRLPSGPAVIPNG